jgi:LmbE family N-acetylglucosaminyl deacetylase
VKAFDLSTSERWLFCLTHPDDELSIAAWIRRLVESGVDVSLCWTHSTPEREAEARAAAGLLGVPQDRLAFLAAPDGRALDEIPRLMPLLCDLLRRFGPTRIACGAFECGHLDHDATNFVVHSTFDGPIFEIPWYHTYAMAIQRVNRFADPVGEEVIELSTEERRLKTELSGMYPSQRIRDLLVWYGVWQTLRFRDADLLGTERMRLQTHFDYATPNLPERLAQGVRRTSAWGRWLEATNRYATMR